MKDKTLPLNWSKHESSSYRGKIYYFNSQTGETRWHRPTETILENRTSKTSDLSPIAVQSTSQDKKNETKSSAMFSNTEEKQKTPNVCNNVTKTQDVTNSRKRKCNSLEYNETPKIMSLEERLTNFTKCNVLEYNETPKIMSLEERLTNFTKTSNEKNNSKTSHSSQSQLEGKNSQQEASKTLKLGNNKNINDSHNESKSNNYSNEKKDFCFISNKKNEVFKKKFSVSDRLKKHEGNTLLKHSTVGIFKKTLPNKAHSKYESFYKDHLIKLTEELQSAEKQIAKINSITEGIKQGTKEINSGLLSRQETSKVLDLESKNEKDIHPKESIENKISCLKSKDSSYLEKAERTKKFSVNDRLKKLQKELQAKQSTSSRSKKEEENNIVNNSFIEPMDVEMEFEKGSVEEREDHTNDLADSQPESMEWEYIDEEINRNIKEMRNQSSNETGALSNYCDTYKKRLVKLFSQNNKNSEEYDKDKCYLVIDTNVFIKDLQFLNDLVNKKSTDANGITLVVPYVVLQELDKLKTNDSRMLSELAVRAIKYLNEKFEMKHPNVRGQSALDAENYLITIQSPDDCIINCCLQIKDKAPSVGLITHDINLKNKARSSNINCFSKNDFGDIGNI